MHSDYADLYLLTARAPVWWDEYAVPRWCEFAPLRVANIYAREVALLRIACQSCGREFRVAESWSRSFDCRVRMSVNVAAGHLPAWGDPPNTGCCPAGATMSSDTLAVVEFWRQDGGAWERVPSLESEAA